MGGREAEDNGLKWLLTGILGVWFLALIYFGFSGATSKPTEGDSLAYHLPIAQIVSSGKILDRTAYTKAIFFYPAMGETLLSGITALGIPANVYNVLGWVVLAAAVYGVGRRAGLGKNAAAIAALGVAMWPSVVRLLNNQTVDVWLAVWWTASVWWWEKKNKTIIDWGWLGVMMGMTAGTKVSGLIYTVILLAVYLKEWTGAGKEGRRMFWAGLLGVGGIWYARNWGMTGNPFFPAQILGFKGDSGFHLMDWSPWKTILDYPGGIILLVTSLASEFLIWAGLLLLPIVVRNRWVLLGWLNFGVYFFLPSWPVNTLSDLRYTFVAFIPLMIGMWGWVKEKGWETEAATLTLLVVAAEMTQLDFRPKLWWAGIAGYMIWMMKHKTKSGTK